jgi:tRNA-dihydrouridine synthase
MTDLKLAERIIQGVVDRSRCPVTVKLRSGPDASNICAATFAIMAENNGVSAVSVHGRTWKQGFSGQADWNIVSQVKRQISIPVFGNGDITGYSQALDKIEQSGCDAVLIGRGAIGNPWIFNPSDRPSSLSAISSVALTHMHLIERFNENQGRALGAIKNHLGKYFRGIPGSAKIRKTVYEQPDWTSLKALIQSCKACKENTGQARSTFPA